MRSVSVRVVGAALLLFLVLSPAVPAFAGRIHTPPGVVAEEEPPQAEEGRIHGPGGLTAEQESELAPWDFFLVWLFG